MVLAGVGFFYFLVVAGAGFFYALGAVVDEVFTLLEELLGAVLFLFYFVSYLLFLGFAFFDLY